MSIVWPAVRRSTPIRAAAPPVGGRPPAAHATDSEHWQAPSFKSLRPCSQPARRSSARRAARRLESGGPPSDPGCGPAGPPSRSESDTQPRRVLCAARSSGAVLPAAVTCSSPSESSESGYRTGSAADPAVRVPGLRHTARSLRRPDHRPRSCCQRLKRTHTARREKGASCLRDIRGMPPRHPSQASETRIRVSGSAHAAGRRKRERALAGTAAIRQ